MIVDLSANNADPATIDWAKAKAAGLQAVFGKATQGTDYTNPYWPGYVSACKTHGIPLAGYHFADWGDANAEAAHFVSVAGRHAKILDVETSTDVGWMEEFLAALNEPADQEMTYGSASTLPHAVRSLLWPADYGRNPGVGECWQYTDAGTVPGIPGQVDLSRWTGTQQQLNKFVDAQEDGMFGNLAESKQDEFNATLRFLWYSLRTDGITAKDQSSYWYAYNLPAAQKGFGGCIDLVVAQVHDTAQTAGTLRKEPTLPLTLKGTVG